jgi:hypothetical protein
MDGSTACITDDPAHSNDNNVCFENTNVVPEPGTLVLMASGLTGMLLVVGRRRRRRAPLGADDIIT